MKTQSTIWLDTKKEFPTDINDFLETIFYDKLFKKDKSSIIQIRNTAEIIIRHIIDKGYFPSGKMKSVLETTKVDQNKYFYALRRLKQVGLIRKAGDNYHLSSIFSKRLNALSIYSNSIISKAKANCEPSKRMIFYGETKEGKVTEEEEIEYLN